VGALDGEVAFLAGTVSKTSLFQGGVSSLDQGNQASSELGLPAYIEGAIKAVRQLHCSAPSADEVLLSGRMGADPGIFQRLSTELSDIGPVMHLKGFASIAKQGAQGAALLADGLAGGTEQDLVDWMRIREARGTVLDHLVFISPAAARLRLGIPVHD
jgi:predicted butyrate kinase (DUF1464 family)